MSYTFGFNNPEYEPYDGLETEEDVYQAVHQEVEKAVSDLGSDGYDLVWPDLGPNPTEENVKAMLDRLDPGAADDAVLEAHRLGVRMAVARHMPGVLDDLWTFGDSTLPDGTRVWLRGEGQ